MRWHDHIPAIQGFQPFMPFTQVVEGEIVEDAALYLGFWPLPSADPRPALPPGRWIQLRIDVDETTRDAVNALDLVWEYWQGKNLACHPNCRRRQGI